MFRVKRFFLAVFLSLFVLGCNSCAVISPSNDPDKVEIILHTVREGSFIGLPIVYEAQIINNNPFTVMMDEFIKTQNQGRQQLLFSPPNGAHLIAPDGEDLFLPFRSDTQQTGQSSSLAINANSEYWFKFHISEYLHIRQAGDYTFWLEMQDSTGTIYKSNIVEFEIRNVVQTVSSELIDLDLAFEKTVYGIDDLKNVDVAYEYTFFNNSPKPITLLKQRTTVNINIMNPVYEFTIMNDSGKLAPRMLSDVSNYSDPVYDENHLVTLQPGDSYTNKKILPHFPDMRDPGQYLVQLTYIVYDINLLDGTPMDWEDSVFRGLIESNKVILNIEE